MFPSLELGVAFMREVARQRCAPASIRLMDSMQFQMGQEYLFVFLFFIICSGQSMKAVPSFAASILDSIKKTYVTKVTHESCDICVIFVHNSLKDLIQIEWQHVLF